MLFVALLKLRAGAAVEEEGTRRRDWQYPEGITPVAEYWLETESPRVLAIIEADSVAPLGAFRRDWDDRFEIEIVPAVTAEEGLEAQG